MAGIFGLTKLLPAPEGEEPTPQPTPETTPLPDETSFRDSIKVNGATISLNGDETTIIPTSGYRVTSFKNVLDARAQNDTNGQTNEYATPTAIPTATPQPVEPDSLAGLKAKFQNDAEYRKVAEDALRGVAVNGNYGRTVEEKLDFIMQMIEQKNVDCILSQYDRTGGIKNLILNFCEDSVEYFAEKELKTDISIRYEKNGSVTFTNSSGNQWIATTDKKVANVSDTNRGTMYTMSSNVAGILGWVNRFRQTNYKADDQYSYIAIDDMSTLLRMLNTLGDSQIVISRNENEESR